MTDFPRVDAILEAEAAYSRYMTDYRSNDCDDDCDCVADYGDDDCVCHCHAQVREAWSVATDADYAELRRRSAQEVSRQNAVILEAEAIVFAEHGRGNGETGKVP